MALSNDQLRDLSRLYDRWQSGDAAARDAVQLAVDVAGSDVARAFALMLAHTDTEITATLLPPLPQAMRESAVRVAGQAKSDPASGTHHAAATRPLSVLSGAPDPPARQAGQHVGPYRLIKELGRGGMGVVWLAERADGQHHRQVALKMPLLENLNWMLAARFARERNILASLEHPSIARLYDAGIDDTTQPYIAIEYVVGLPINAYVSEHKLKPEAIVHLFARVIEAVAHAHAQLVIHRDIKPSNILVDAKGDPHLLDFGIAKLLDDDDTLSVDATQLTRLSGRALTLDYASPEQINNAPLGVGSDVYALGVVLYELLTGSRPYHPKGPTRRDLELAILEQEPSKPSEHLLGTGTSNNRSNSNSNSNSETGKSARRMRGDLDTVVLKALRKDPKLRYASAQAFADDLKRYLRYQPIQARPDGALYRVTKFIRRQRVPLVITALSCAVIAGLAWRAWQQQQVAQASTARAESIDGLLQNIFQGMSPDVAAERRFTAVELLDRARSYLAAEGGKADQALRKPQLRMADLYRELGAYPQALALYQSESKSAAASGTPREQAMALWRLANITTKARMDADASRYITEMDAALASWLKPPDELFARQRIAAGQLAFAQERYADALRFYGAANAELDALFQPNVELRAWALNGEGSAARRSGDFKRARSRLQASLALHAQATGARSVDALIVSMRMAELDVVDNQFSSAVENLATVVPELESRLGPQNANSRGARRLQAVAQLYVGDFAACQRSIAELDRTRESGGDWQRGEVTLLGRLSAMMLMYSGDARRASIQMRALIEPQSDANSAAKNAPTADSLRVRRIYAESLLRADQTADALAELSTIHAAQIVLLGDADADVATTRVLLAVAYAKRGQAADLAEAQRLIAQAADALAQLRGEHARTTLMARAYRGVLNPDSVYAEPALMRDFGFRIEREMGWQSGAAALVAQIRALPKPVDVRALSVVF